MTQWTVYPVLILAFIGIVLCKNKTTKTIDVTLLCPDVLYRVDSVDELWVKGGVEFNESWWMKRASCRMTFETTFDQGLCVDIKELDIDAEDVTLDFLTSTYRPEKHYDKQLSGEETWCTHNNMVTMVLSRPPMENFLQQSAFRFRFRVSNRTVQEIERVYNMGSPAHCDMHYTLRGSESGVIHSQLPPNTDPAPSTCEMTFTTLSQEEYGQVCVSIETFDIGPECDMKLTMTGLDTNYWQEEVVWDCNTNLNLTREVCSMDRQMTVHLTRDRATNSANFKLNVDSKWMTYWESAEEVKVELNYLAAAKSFTVLIATLDTLIALSAAFISIATRYPYGKVGKYVGDMFAKDPSIPHHYGNDYPVAIAVTSGTETEPPPF